MKPTRRRLLLYGGALGAAALVGARLAVRPFFHRGRAEPLDGDLARFAEGCFYGLDPSLVWDLHAHLLGLGAGGSGCEVNPRMRSHLHPLLRLQYDVFSAAGGITNERNADADYLERVLDLHRLAHPAGRIVLLAFDRFVGEDGVEDPARTPFHVPNEYVLRIAARQPDVEAGVSIHPYRRDAVERLVAAAEAGARLVKWLPAAMGIDPSSPLCDSFYSALAELRLPLLTHAGRELAVDTPAAQELGNPLHLRRALDAGVQVIVAHCASLGNDRDLDTLGKPERPSFELFLRMMREPRSAELLFGDVSMVAAINRCCDPLTELLRAEDLHPRLVNGSDYPLPAVWSMISTWRLSRAGLISGEERRQLNAIFDANPLLFDFCLKRTVSVEKDGRLLRFPASVFETGRLFDA